MSVAAVGLETSIVGVSPFYLRLATMNAGLNLTIVRFEPAFNPSNHLISPDRPDLFLVSFLRRW
ncbi:hypothetical protein [Qipengyuania atrilutea]|uniref:Uncharacterized protein n=1 Tax=Qipengyuania atrilutea TaxID=2744473 RepID=A0A850GZ10_9SPHN|nr:hypothetical protein [Actirhodobacter atriluteus]NVD44851.1 hypothetical protein [Actirhodobacter atriluteus]